MQVPALWELELELELEGLPGRSPAGALMPWAAPGSKSDHKSVCLCRPVSPPLAFEFLKLDLVPRITELRGAEPRSSV